MKVTKIFKRIKCEIMYRQATAKADYASKKNNGEIFSRSSAFSGRNSKSLGVFILMLLIKASILNSS